MLYLQYLQRSFAYNFIYGAYLQAVKICSASAILKQLMSIPSYTQPDKARNSLIFRGLSGLFYHLLRPLNLLGTHINRLAANSQILRTKAPPLLENSLAWQGIRGGARVESALWLLVAYAPVDYLLRNVSSLSFLAGGWDELLIIFIIAAWPLQGALTGNITFKKTALDIPIMIYAGIVLFLYFMRSRDASLALEGARVYLEYLLWFFIATNLITRRKQLGALTAGLIAVATAMSLLGVIQFILGVEMPKEWVDQAEAGIRTRVFSIVTSPNVLGSFLVLFIPVTLATLLGCRQKKYKLTLAACLAIMLPCLVVTYSRGAWLALAGAMLVFSLLYRPGAIIPLTLGGLAAVKLVPGIGSRLSYMFSPAYFASSQRGGRVARWSMALDRLKNDPWLGEGFGRFGGAVAARRVPGSFYVDNFYLKTAVESGLIGLLAFLWLLFCAFRVGVDSYRRTGEAGLKLLTAGILAGLTGVMLHNGVENIFEVPMMASYFWFMAGMLAVIPELKD